MDLNKRALNMKINTASISIRLASAGDLPAINDIYNYYVLNSTCTYQELPETLDDRKKWFEHHGERHPITVAISDGKVVGWGSLSPFHARSAYRYSVENSVYLDHRFHRRGIGSAVLEDLIKRAKALGHHTIIAGADGEQTASLALHEKFGFVRAAHFKQVGFKFGRWLDVIYMQLML
jgi:phosphinothricin acetyltransferase